MGLVQWELSNSEVPSPLRSGISPRKAPRLEPGGLRLQAAGLQVRLQKVPCLSPGGVPMSRADLKEIKELIHRYLSTEELM